MNVTPDTPRTAPPDTPSDTHGMSWGDDPAPTVVLTPAATGGQADVDPVDDVQDATVTTPMSAPDAPAASDDDDVVEEVVEDRAGIPAGNLAVGGLATAAVALGTLYQVAGLAGLVWGAAGTAGSAGGYLYYRHRDRFTSTGRTRGSSSGGGSTSTGGGASRTGGGLRLLGGGGRSRSGDGIGGVLGSIGRERRKRRGAAGGHDDGAGGPGRERRRRRGEHAGGPGGPRVPAASPTGTRKQDKQAKKERRRREKADNARRSRRTGNALTRTVRSMADGIGNAGRTTGRATWRAATATGRSTRNAAVATGRTIRRAAVTAGRHGHQAARWVNARTGGRAGRAGRLVWRGSGQFARMASRWIGRHTGKRLSNAWRASRSSTGWRQTRRNAAAALWRWDGQVTASAVAVLALLVGRWRRYRAAKAAPAQTTESATTTETSAATTAAEPAAAEGGQTGTTGPAVAPGTDLAVVGTARWSGGHGSYRRPYSSIRRNAMFSAGFPLATAAAEMNATAAVYAPPDMWVVARELDQLPSVPANVAMAVRTYTTRLQGEYPIHQAVIEKLAQFYTAHRLLIELAGEIGPLFRQVHADDLKREEAPRVNEPMWNV